MRQACWYWLIGLLVAGMASGARPEAENLPKPGTRSFAHIDWCRDYAGGKPRVLFIANQVSAWDSYALTLRMDLDFEVFYTSQPWIFAPETDYYHEGIRLLPAATAELTELLTQPWQVVVFVDFHPINLPRELHFRVLEKVTDGTGVVTFMANRWNTNWRYQGVTAFTETAIPAQVLPLTGLSLPAVAAEVGKAVPDMRGVMLPTTVRYPAEPYTLAPIAAYRVGKGLVFNVAPGGANYFGGPAMHPSRHQSPEELTQNEYFYSLAAKLILEAAGMPPAVRLTLDPPATTSPGSPSTLNGTLSASFAGEALVVLRTHRNEIRYQQTVPLPAGEKLALALPGLPAGRYFADVWLRRDGKTVEWASTHLTVAAAAAIDAIELAKPTFAPGERLTGTVTVTNAPVGSTLTASLSDAEERLLLRQGGIAVTNGRASLDLPLDRTRELRHLLTVELMEGDVVVATAQVPVFTPRPVEDDLFVYTDGEAKNLNGKRRLDLYRELGITTVELGVDGVAPYLDQAMASGLQPGYRIWTTHCNSYTGGCISSHTYPAALSGAFAHMTRLMDPYGLAFFSIGDDSGVASDFCASPPNWVRSYVVKLAAHYAGDMNAYAKAHGIPRPFGNFRYMMQQGTLATVAGIAPLPEELPLLAAAWRENYADIATFNRAHGTAFASFDAIDLAVVATATAPSPCLLGFQKAMQAQYGSIASLNAAWGTELSAFTDIGNNLIDELLAAGKFSAKLDKVTYLEELFLRNMEAAGSGVRSATSREIGIGMGAASIGNIIPEVLTRINASMPYKGDRDLEIIRSVPHKYCGQTIGVYGGKAVPEAARANQAWETVLTGGNFIWFWSMIVGGIEGDLSINPGRSGYMLETIREMQSGLARALIQAERQHDGIAILHSRRAGALGSFHKELGSLESSQVGFQRIIEDLGLQYRYTWTAEVEAGGLDSGEFKLLILPYTQILSDDEVAAIERFVRAGGTVLADLRCATHDWAGKPLPQGRLDALFGIRQAPGAAVPLKADLAWGERQIANLRGDGSVTASGAEARATLGETPAVLVNRVGEGRTIFLNHSPTTYNILLGRHAAEPLRELYLGLLAEAGIVPRFRIVTEAYGPAAGAEIALFRRGAIDYLSIEKNSYEFEQYPIAGTIELDQPYAVYDMRAGKALGRTDKIPVTLTGLGTYLYALLPEEPGALVVDLPASAAAGSDVRLEAQLGTTAEHTVRVDVFRPDGTRLWPLIKLEGKDGAVAVTVPLAHNDPVGTWRVVVTDVTTGRAIEKNLEVTR